MTNQQFLVCYGNIFLRGHNWIEENALCDPSKLITLEFFVCPRIDASPCVPYPVLLRHWGAIKMGAHNTTITQHDLYIVLQDEKMLRVPQFVSVFFYFFAKWKRDLSSSSSFISDFLSESHFVNDDDCAESRKMPLTNFFPYLFWNGT